MIDLPGAKPKIAEDSPMLVLLPRLRVTDAAPTLSEMPGACSVNVALLLTPPPVALTVSVYLPGATALPTVMPKMLLPEPGALMVPVDAVTPLGRPVVPEVYMMTQRSSGLARTFGRAAFEFGP